MDYIKSEERLIAEELKLTTRLRQTEILSKLDSAMIKTQGRLPEQITSPIKTAENLSTTDNLILPLKIVGRMLGVGRHKVRYYKAEELKKSVERYVNKVIPIKVDHKRNEVGATVGAVDRIYWDDNEQVIKYEGHINDATQARNILDGVVKEVSASIDSVMAFDPQYGVTGQDPEYAELSLVEEGAFKGNSLQVAV